MIVDFIAWFSHLMETGYDLTWGIPVIIYLFLAGMGAGALATSASVLLRGGPKGTYFRVARFGAFIAPVPVGIGCGMLIFELGSFEVGNYLRFLNLYKLITISPMSIGTWLLTFFLGVCALYLLTFLPKDAAPGDKYDIPRKILAWIAVPLGIGVAMYTGILLGAMPSRPFWNSPILALLFLLSAMSSGIACILLAWGIFPHKASDEEEERKFRDSGYLLTSTDIMLLGMEMIVLFLFIMYAHLTVGSIKNAVAVILPGGQLAHLFWIWVVLIGILGPAIIEMILVLPRLLNQKPFVVHRFVEIAVPIAILTGGFMLRYVVVIAGQITYPIGF